jgi:hypothetical protein
VLSNRHKQAPEGRPQGSTAPSWCPYSVDGVTRNALASAIDEYNQSLAARSRLPQLTSFSDVRTWDGNSHAGTVLRLGTHGVAVRTGMDAYQYLTEGEADGVIVTSQGISTHLKIGA